MLCRKLIAMEKKVPLSKKTEPRKTSAGMAFDVYETDGNRSYRIQVTEEAIEDFCDPRGIVIEGDDLPTPLFEKIVLVAEKLIQRAHPDVKTVTIDTKTLNG
ncbi:hypothetical protein ASD32_06440 [Rhizobium sp. Root483D2]|nr:hypothetical protein ASD32_06440 [Rhizobium sp. Root483D2]